MQNAQQQKDKGADVWKNGWHKQEGKTTQEMARRHHQVGRYVASETEPYGVGQRKLEEVDETGIGLLRTLSPWLLMTMMMRPIIIIMHRTQNSNISAVLFPFLWPLDVIQILKGSSKISTSVKCVSIKSTGDI